RARRDPGDRRPRARRAGGRERTDLRAVLFHQELDGARAVGLPRHRHRASRYDRRPRPAGWRGAVPDRAAGGRGFAGVRDGAPCGRRPGAEGRSALNRPEPTGARGERRPARGRVLVVEDEAYVRESLDELLRSRGFDVGLADGVADALTMLARTPVDVVLTDLRMPSGGGLELVRRARAMGVATPVIVLTGHGNVASAVECMKAGAQDYLLKPIDPDALEVALEK